MDLRVNIERYIAETLKFSKALNLTSVQDARLFRQRFVEPSLALCEWLPQQGILLDVGSGMGIPGIPILLARSELHGVLVDRRKKRAEFLRHIVRTLKLNADVYDCDVRSLKGIQASVCVARAVTRPETLLNMVAPHMVRGAIAVLPTASEIKAASVSGWNFEGSEKITLGNEQQRIQRYRCMESFT